MTSKAKVTEIPMYTILLDKKTKNEWKNFGEKEYGAKTLSVTLVQAMSELMLIKKNKPLTTDVDVLQRENVELRRVVSKLKDELGMSDLATKTLEQKFMDLEKSKTDFDNIWELQHKIMNFMSSKKTKSGKHSWVSTDEILQFLGIKNEPGFEKKLNTVYNFLMFATKEWALVNRLNEWKILEKEDPEYVEANIAYMTKQHIELSGGE